MNNKQNALVKIEEGTINQAHMIWILSCMFQSNVLGRRIRNINQDDGIQEDATEHLFNAMCIACESDDDDDIMDFIRLGRSGWNMDSPYDHIKSSVLPRRTAKSIKNIFYTLCNCSAATHTSNSRRGVQRPQHISGMS